MSNKINIGNYNPRSFTNFYLYESDNYYEWVEAMYWQVLESYSTIYEKPFVTTDAENITKMQRVLYALSTQDDRASAFIRLRAMSLNAYDYNITDASPLVISNIRKIINHGYEISVYGSLLFRIEADGNLIYVPRWYYAGCENGFTLLDKQHQEEQYLYIYDNTISPLGIIGTIYKYLLRKKQTLASWVDGNTQLFTALIASYDRQELFAEMMHGNPDLQESTDAEKTRLVEDFLGRETAKVSNAEVITSPNIITYSTQQRGDVNIYNSFQQLLKECNDAIEMNLLGEAVTSNNNSGSLAKSQVASQRTSDITWYDVAQVKMLIKDYIRFVSPKTEFSFVENLYNEKTLDVINRISQLGLRTLGGKQLLVDTNAFYKMLSIPKPAGVYTDADKVILGESL